MRAGSDGPARVLIVDDQRQNRRVLEMMLAHEGYVLEMAGSGDEAFAVVAARPPDLILLDIMMPGIDGYQVAARLKSDPATAGIPIIMITALDNREARVLGLAAGAQDFLSKPVDRAELCARVRTLLQLRAYGDYYDGYRRTLEAEVVSRTADLVERTTTLEQQAEILIQQAALLDLAQDAIVVQDMLGRVLFWSRGAELMTGWRRHEAMGRITFDLLKTTLPDPLAAIEAAVLRHGQWEGEVVHHTREGTPVIVCSRWAVQLDKAGMPARILTINNDITKNKQIEAERQLLTDRLSLATAVARVGVWEWDLTADTFIWDARMFEIYGFPRLVPMPYRRWSDAVDPLDLPVVESALAAAIETKGSTACEFRITRGDGDVRIISTMQRVVLDATARVVRVIGVNSDVTDSRASDDAREQSRKAQLRFKDEFLSHVSHELRSPLTAIKQFTTILAGGLAGELSSEQLEYQQIVMKNVGQLQAMIDDLLEVTRLETGKLTVEQERVSVSDAVTDATNTLRFTAGAKGVTLVCNLPAFLPIACADRTRLRQILIILLDNAIKFTAAGGVATVSAELLAADPRFLQIKVSDTGCGISPQMAERIFERLYQADRAPQVSRKGLGLGLYICRELVLRQGGDIRLESTAEPGSTFAFTLPVFDLQRSIAPLLKDNQWPAESVAVVVVKAGGAGTRPVVLSREEWCQRIGSVVESCLLPDLDVLLPRGDGADGEAQFFVAAFGDERGVVLLTRRIREQMSRNQSAIPAGLVTSVSYRMVPRTSLIRDADPERMLVGLVAALERTIEPARALEALHPRRSESPLA